MGLEIIQKFFITESRLASPLLEGSQVFLVLRESCSHSIIDDVRYGSVSMRSLKSKCRMEIFIKVDCRPFRTCAHGITPPYDTVIVAL
jgi:hypothetical protein